MGQNSVRMPSFPTREPFQAMNRRKCRFVIWHIDREDLIIKTLYVSKRNENYLDFIKHLPDIECRYAAYDHEFKTHDNRLTSKMYFFFWTPSNANQENNVIYSQAMKLLRDQVVGCVNYSLKKQGDVHDRLGNENIGGEFTRKQEAKEEEEDSDFE